MNRKFSFSMCVTVLLFHACEKRVVIPNPAYAIGKITQYNPDSKDASIFFYYYIGRDTLQASYPEGHHGWHVPANGNLKTGQQFMVQYNPAKTKEARMMFCFEVKDSSDYNRYIAEFATTAPTCY